MKQIVLLQNFTYEHQNGFSRKFKYSISIVAVGSAIYQNRSDFADFCSMSLSITAGVDISYENVITSMIIAIHCTLIFVTGPRPSAADISLCH